MAYVDRFIFRFNSVSGKAVRIAIADNDYTGAAVERRLGGSPQLRCELSGNIHGMSLEIPAECKVDDEFAVLYTSDPTRFAVRLEVDNVVVWRGFVTPELYAAPWVDPPYDVQITATDGLGELKMKEWPAIGSRTLKEILDTVLGATGLALGIRIISAAANDIAAAADLLTGTTVNLDHMAGKSYYDVLDGLLGSLHCTISQRGGAWLLVRETDVTSLTSGGQVSDTSGNTYPVKSFGSSKTHDCWPVGRLTTEIVPAKSVVEVECPNHLASLIADPDMELNLWQTNGSWTGEDGGYYTLDLNEYISQVITVANASRDADPGFRIKVSSRHTTPFGVGIMRLTVMATGRDPRSGSDKTLYLKEVTTQGRTQMEWVTEESHFDDGLGLPRTLDHQDCKEFETDIFRLPTSFNPLKSITVKVTAGKSTVCVHSVHIECMSVYDKAVTRLVMDNGARGDESNSPLFADSFVGNKGNFLLTNSLRGVAGAIVRTWSSDAIPSVPYGEWLSKDMALSVATPRLRMSGRLFTVTSLPALFYSNKGLSYITEEWSLDLIEDEADISLISLPAAALSTVSVSVIVEDNDGRKGTVSGGEIVSPKTGDSSSGSGYLDWFIAESYEEDGETKYRLKLNPKYDGMYAEGWVSAGGVSDQGGGGGGTGYLRDLLDVNASMSPTQGQALVWDDALGKWTAGDVSVDLTPFERIANRVTTVSSSSNHTQYPTAKAVYDIVNTMLSSAMRFQGVTSTALVDGSTTNPVVVDGASYTATRGDVVVRSDVGLEYLWTGAKWQQLGDETSYAKKTVTITGSGYLTGGGNLEAARTIDIADAIKTKIDNGATAFGYFTDGAANEAIKLRTPRTIWGQPFDGHADVSGAMTGVTSIDSLLNFDTTNNRLGIGVAPSYPLDVDGIIRAEKLIGTATGITETSLEDEEFAYQATPINDIADGYRIDKIKGRTLAWNQLAKLDFTTKIIDGVTVTQNADGSITASGTYSGSSSVLFFQLCDLGVFPSNTKLYCDGAPAGSNVPNGGGWTTAAGGYGLWVRLNAGSGVEPTFKSSYIFATSASTGQYSLTLVIGNGQTINETFRPIIHNLTLMFGAGNEPATVEEFEAMFPEAYYDYTPGELINNCAEAIETTGFNQWDEEWELGSFYRTGEYYPVTDAIRSKNHIPVLPGEQLYFCNRGLDVYITVVFYDGAKNIISVLYESEGDVHNGSIVSCPSNAAYIKFGMAGAYGNFYKNDICINLSDPDRNGEYEPYWSAKTALGLSSIKVKDSNGDILEFNGLASAGDVYDEIVGGKLIRRIGSVDLGTLNWASGGTNVYYSDVVPDMKSYSNCVCSKYASGAPGNTSAASDGADMTIRGGIDKRLYLKDSASLSMSGVMLYYELATPVTYELVSAVPLSGRIDGNGTMRVISDGPVAPFRGDITYGCNPGQMGADASSVKSYLDTMLEIKVVDGQPVLHSKLPLYSDSWISAGGVSDTGEEGGATYLKNLLDVDDNLVESAGYGLVYDGTQWTSEQIVPASRKINGVTLTSDVSLSLGSLSNVSVTGATSGQQLIFNGSEWIAGTPAGAKFFHGTCSTSSSSNTKVVDCPSFTSADLVAGTAIAIVMYNRSDTTSTVTINVNGTGANTLLAGFANRKAWSAGELILAVYDGSGEWDMLPTWYYTYYYGGGGSGGGGGTGSTVVVTPRLSSGTRIATITVDGSATDLFAPSVSVSQTQGSTGGTQIASINSTAIYAPAVTVTQVQASGVEVARIKVGSANPVSIFAPSGSSGSSGVQTVVGRTGDVTTDQIATALTNAGYKLTDTVQDLSGYLPLTAGSSKALTNTLYTRGLLPTANASYDLGSLSAAYNNTYTKRVYLADGVYIEYDSTNRCVYVHGAGIATDSFVSAGGVSTTSN